MSEMNKQELLNELNEIKDSHNIASIFGNGAIYGVTIAMQLIEQLDEPEKVVIPQFVAESFEKAEGGNWFAEQLIRAMYNSSDEVGYWLEVPSNEKLLLRAWLDGYKVEGDPKYYAKLKEIRPLEGEWLTNLSGPNYYALDTKGLMLGEFILDLVGLKTEASTHTLKDWERHGINDSNADFVEVAE